MHIFPKADIPVFSISLDRNDSNTKHFELGAQLQKLRDEGILVIGMGNIVHNLSLLDFSGQKTLTFGHEFDTAFKKAVKQKDYMSLVEPWNLS